ncbi:hypothetical protein F5883DRAFT_552230 [Diaporthe sp. PMI_573]|nr:hypothetical protein F5883DRAFT_552230 [Diaporthaceae sp. PMI_573]
MRTSVGRGDLLHLVLGGVCLNGFFRAASAIHRHTEALHSPMIPPPTDSSLSQSRNSPAVRLVWNSRFLLYLVGCLTA